MEFTLLWAAATGVGGLWAGTRLFRSPVLESPFDGLLGAAMAGLATGRVVEMVSQGLNPVTNPFDLFIVRGGVDTGAAATAAIITLFLTTGRSTGTLDSVAPPALLGLASWHLGCLWRGACLGTASELPWAWAEPGSSITRHPVEIYATIGLMVGALAVSRLPAPPGVRAGAALVVASAMRLVTEPLRLSLSGGPVVWYVAGIIVGSVALLVSWIAGRRSNLSVAG